MEILKIGTMVYLVSRVHKLGKTVVPARIGGYQEIAGEIYPILKIQGSRVPGNPLNYDLYTDLKLAVESITPKKKK